MSVRLFARSPLLLCIAGIILLLLIHEVFVACSAEKTPCDASVDNPVLLQQAELIAALEHRLSEVLEKESIRSRHADHLRGIPFKQPASLPDVSATVADGIRTNQPVAKASNGPTIGVIIFTYNRPDYLQRTLSQVLDTIDARPDRSRFRVSVSQDGGHQGVRTLLRRFQHRLHEVIEHQQNMANKHQAVSWMRQARKENPMEKTYRMISEHFLSSLTKMFATYEQVIVLEDDMEISIDFFDYFSILLPVLQQDPTLLCVSAWNDNGFAENVADPRMLYRTDVFPGLGWMMLRKQFDQVKTNWPHAFWDEYFRTAEVSAGKTCIRPEINRVSTFGTKGSSHGQFYTEYLNRIVLNKHAVDWSLVSIDNVRTADNFDASIRATLKTAVVVKLEDISSYDGGNRVLRLYYEAYHFKQVANTFHIMDDEKNGMRRTSYKGVIIFRWKSNLMVLTKTWPD